MNSEKNKLEKSLAQMLPGEEANVVSVNGNDSITKRLMEMGVVPGTLVRLIKTAPLGDPLEVRVRGYHLALRHSEAQTIIISQND